MNRLNIAIIHGIGINVAGYADPLIKGVARQFNRRLQKILATSEDFTAQLNFIPIVWDDIVAEKEARLEDIFQKELRRRRHINWLYRGAIVAISLGMVYLIFNHSFYFIVLGVLLMYFIPKLVYMLRTNFAANFAGDITSYNDAEAKALILARIRDCILPLVTSQERAGVSIISHSLGTVIASDFVWEETFGRKADKLFDRQFMLSNFFTMGSPLPLFSLQFGGPELFNKPISVQDPDGRWVNIFDINDPIAHPLKPLNAEYDRVVSRDAEVKVGLFGMAHVKYWADPRVHAIIANKLALDWLRINSKLDKAPLERLYSRYDLGS